MALQKYHFLISILDKALVTVSTSGNSGIFFILSKLTVF